MSPTKVDKTDPKYKRDLYLYSAIVIFLTVSGGYILGKKIDRNEKAIQSGEMREMIEENKKNKPGIEQGIIN